MKFKKFQITVEKPQQNDILLLKDTHYINDETSNKILQFQTINADHSLSKFIPLNLNNINSIKFNNHLNKKKENRNRKLQQ